MKKLTTRLTAMLLAGILVIGSVPGAVFAADADARETAEYAEEVCETAEESSEAADAGAEVAEEEAAGASEGNVADTSEEAAIQYYTVTLDANGGYFENEWDDAVGEIVKQAEVVEKHIPVDGTVAAFPVCINSDGKSMLFAGWSLERDGELVITGDEEYAPVGNCVLYAVWEAAEAEDVGVADTERETEAVEETESAQEYEEAETGESAQESEVTEAEEDTNTTQETAEDEYAAPETDNEQDTTPAKEDIYADEKEEETSEEAVGTSVVESSEEEEIVKEDAANGVEESGTCGDNLTWTLDEAGTLTISGMGEMSNYGNGNNMPWSSDLIKAVIIENGVTSVGNAAFYKCINLKSVTIPESVTSIGISSFPHCYALESVTIPDSVTNIGNYSFWSCTGLNSLTISNSITKIGSYTFANLTNLTNVIIPNNVISIESNAFFRCSSLTSVTIPNSVTSIGDGAFDYCSNISTIYFEGNAPSIEATAFGNVTATAYYPANDPTWTEEVRQNYGGQIKWVLWDPGATNMPSGTCGPNLTWMLNTKTGTLAISGTGEMANYFNSGDMSPWSKNWGSIRSVVFEDTVTTIGNSAFYYCKYLTNIEFPSDLSAIGDYAFYGCSLTSVTIPNSVTSIGDCAFEYCSSLTSVTIPNSVTSIGDLAFIYCESLNSFVVESGNLNYSSENGVLFNKDQTVIISWPSGKGGDCQIPNSVTSIGNSAFYGCYVLTSVTIPNSVTSIGNRAFNECIGLTSVTIPKSVTSIGTRAFQACMGLTSVTIPNSVTRIEERTFASCNNLTSVTIPNSVTNIGDSAFDCCDLTSVTIPNSVTSIGTSAFGHCSILSDIYFKGNAPSIASDSLSYVTATAYYPANDPTWTEDVRQNYGGNITWVEWDPKAISGTCGPNLTWTLNGEGTLTISGTGEMDDYNYSIQGEEPPWNKDNQNIKKIIVKDGVTTIGDSAFSFLPFLYDVDLPPSITVIGREAICGCFDLKKISIPNGVRVLKERALYNNQNLKVIYLPSSLEQIEENAFLNVKITHVCYGGNKNAWLNIDIDSTGNDSIDYHDTKIHFNSENINDYPQKDWWGFSNNEVTKNHHIEKYVWLSVLGTNIVDQFSGWYFGDEETKPGLCSGMAETAMLFDGNYINYSDFEQEEDFSRVYDLNKDAYNKTVDMNAEDMIKLAFVLQYIPDFYEKVYSTNVNKYDELYSAINHNMLTKLDPVYLCLQGPDGNHALWAYALEEDDEYCDIYAYDCNQPEYPQIIRLFGKYQSFSGFQYLNPDNTHPFTGISFASHIDDVVLAIAKYHQLSPVSPLVSIRQKGYVIVNVQDGITYVKDSYNNLIPIRPANTDGISGDNPGLFYCRAENAVSVCNDEETDKTISFTDDVSTFEITLPQNASAEYQDYSIDAHYSEGDTLSSTYTTVSGEETINIGLSGNTANDMQFDFSGNELIVNGQSDLEITVNYNDIVTATEINANKDGAIHIKTDDTDENDVQLVVSIDNNNDGVSEENNTFNLSDGQLISLTEENVQVTFSPEGSVNNDVENPQYLYTGKAIKPRMGIQKGNKVLTEGTDYEVSYTNNTNIGTATVTITGKGNYTGTISKIFTISAAAIANATVSGISNKTYTGSALTQNPTVKVGDQTLTKDTDYTVSYTNNTKVGTATVKITGKGNYTGTVSKTFKINGIPVSNATVSGISNKTYTGSAITQNPAVKVGDKTLTKNTDYTVSYQNNTNVGTATVTITGKGNYASKKTVTFKINKAAQSITAKAGASRVAVGKTTTVAITGAKGKKSYKSSNTAIATVDSSTGKVTAKKVGTVKITATSAATANYNAASKTVTIKVVPAATASLAAANQVKGIKLTWKKVTGANGYKVYRGSTLIKTITSGSTVTFADTKANTNGTKYTYKVVAKATTGDSTLSKSRVIYRVSRPTVSSATNSASKKMTVKWGKNAKANGYQIQYSTDKNFKSGNKAVSITSASTVSKVIGSLTKGKTYYVRIRTYKTVGSTKYWSIWSTARSVKISK